MRYNLCVFLGCLWWACFVLLCGAVVATAIPLEQPTPETPPLQVSSLASEAYSLLADLPHIGIDRGKENLDRLIVSAKRLLDEDSTWETQFSLALREAIAHGLIYEMYRSEAMRLEIGLEGQPASIPFQKQNFLDLWDANLPTEARVLTHMRRGNDAIVKGLSAKGVEDAAILDGYKFRQINEEVRDRFSKLKSQAHGYSLHGKRMSTDEQFVQSLVMLQSLRDLNTIVRVYDKSGLLKDRDEFRAAIDDALQGEHKRRMDDGMRASSLKVLSTFGKYCSMNEDAYVTQQAMLLGPYMTNTDNLPVPMQAHLNRRKKEVQSKESDTGKRN